MRAIRFLIVVGFILLMTGCPARSLFPLFTEDDLVFDESLLGTWIDQSGNNYMFQKGKKTPLWPVGETRGPEKGYSVLVSEETDTAAYNVHLGKIGGFWFLDSTPARTGGDLHLLPAHLFIRIEIKKDTITMATLESDWLRARIEAGLLNISHVNRDGEIVLTAPPEDLQKAIKTFATDNNAFPSWEVLVRKR